MAHEIKETYPTKGIYEVITCDQIMVSERGQMVDTSCLVRLSWMVAIVLVIDTPIRGNLVFYEYGVVMWSD